MKMLIDPYYNYCINNYILFFSTQNTDSWKTKTLRVAVVIILLIAFMSTLLSRLKHRPTDYVDILPFRLLRDQCYRADISIMIYKLANL